MAFLPEGLELVDADEQPIPVRINKADSRGPDFIVHVKRLSPLELKALVAAFNARNQGQRAGRMVTKEQVAREDRAWNERFAKRVMVGWEGLTIPNFQELDRGKTKLAGNVDEAIAKGVEIPFSLEAALHLLTNAWPEVFSDLIFEKVKNGADQSAEADSGND